MTPAQPRGEALTTPGWGAATAAEAAARLARRPEQPGVTLPGLRRIVHTMGMPVCFDLRDDLPPARLEALVDAAARLLAEVDRVFSPYRPDSAVCRRNRGEPVGGPDGEQLREILDRCVALRDATEGAFDAWAAGSFDPSGLVKGWAVERVSALLAAGGSVHHCVNAGGDVRVRGDARPDEGWRIGIRHPYVETAICCVVAGRDLAVATSGSYERGAHILDSRTGRAPAHPVASVTVTGPDLAVADAYATALFARGRDCRGWAAERMPAGYEVLVTDVDGVWRTPGLPSVAGV